ncbi:glycerol-3-phosphate cytidylyltransferase [Bowmanella denitrificans]|uniref:glycerol-3-phosphate cytidylyltransferase n=1 Tax=Bowmanella denitrificans TaxID=366582 RepID=UPI000C9CC7D0|nr:glycerol-3-phosphate cytidylyltransferase [Bowmanella denitrificans]
MTTVLTYGTFDLLHIGHLNILEGLKAKGDKLIVGVSTDEFNQQKGKRSLFSYEQRARMIAGLKCVDMVIPEEHWQQKADDIKEFDVDIFGMGSDWQGKFDHLNELCEVIYLPRTPDVSSTNLKNALSVINKKSIQDIKNGLDNLYDIVKAMG